MLKNSVIYPFFVLFYIVFTIVGIKKKFPITKHFFYLSLFIYFIGVISITLFPIPVNKALIQDIIKDGYTINYNFIPFNSIFSILSNNNVKSIIRLLGGNILMFIPLGYLIPMIFKSFSKFNKIVILGVASSFLIEFAQGFIAYIIGYRYRIVDVDDIILNTFGAIIGYLVFTCTASAIGNIIDLNCFRFIKSNNCK